MLHVVLDVATRLVDLVEQRHLLLDQVHHVINVAAVTRDQLLLLLEDLLDELFVLSAQLVRVTSVLYLQGFHGRHSIIQIH